MTGLRVALLGNHGVSYSSESHYALTFEALGHTVLRIQEGDVRATDIASIVRDFNADLFFHVQTRGLAITGGTELERQRMYQDIPVPKVGYHLDLFFGLDRAEYVHTDPYFTGMDYFFSTDNGHDDEWGAAGVNHYYLPPGVYHAECYDALPNPRYSSDIAFVGSWKSYAHEEHWQVRRQMLQTLRRRYGRRFKCWPQGQAVRGTDLTELYASVKVVVGDSCLAGKVRGYWSDRVAETTGRGGFLVHPYVPGILDVHPNLVTYEPGNWTQLVEKVDYFLANDSDRELSRKQNAEYTRTHNTYLNRLSMILEAIGLA